MSLQTLPSELLQLILDHITVDYIRCHLYLLTLYRQWYEVVHAMLIRDLKVLFTNISRLPPPSSHTYNLFKAYTVQITLSTADLLAKDNKPPNLDSVRWLKVQMQPLIDLVAVCTRLESIKLQIPPRWRTILIQMDGQGMAPMPPTTFCHGLLIIPSIDKLLSRNVSKGLTSLYLDSFGLFPVSRRIGSIQPNLCSLISSRLGTLRKLHVATHVLCPRMLEAEHIPGKLPMEELVIVLSQRDPHSGEKCMAWQCRSSFGRSTWRSPNVMGTAVHKLWSRSIGGGSFRVEQYIGHPQMDRLVWRLGPDCVLERYTEDSPDPIVLEKIPNDADTSQFKRWLIPAERPLSELEDEFEWNSDILDSDEDTLDHEEGEIDVEVDI